jgi:glycosyltransferase involved in cell wall biosynthesis
MTKLSVVVAAYNEEKYLPETLECIARARGFAQFPCEVIVVDNDSQDDTRHIAETAGATVVFDGEHNIARVRNAGAARAGGDVLVFVDADTHVAPTLFRDIATVMKGDACAGGAVGVRYDRIERRWVRWYLGGWAFWSKAFGMAQGAAQFCRKQDFDELGGYDETIYMGEDVEFYWRLSAHARRKGGGVRFLAAPVVTTSGRRFNRMSARKILVLTNPVFIRLTWRRQSWWKDWYHSALR